MSVSCYNLNFLAVAPKIRTYLRGSVDHAAVILLPNLPTLLSFLGLAGINPKRDNSKGYSVEQASRRQRVAHRYSSRLDHCNSSS